MTIWRHIAVDSIQAADGVLAQIQRRVANAADSPAIGVLRRELGDGRRILVVGSYLVIYEPEPGGVLVIAVVHGMRDPKAWLD